MLFKSIRVEHLMKKDVTDLMKKLPDDDIKVYLEEIALSEFRNFKLQILAEKIKLQKCRPTKFKMLYY